MVFLHAVSCRLLNIRVSDFLNAVYQNCRTSSLSGLVWLGYPVHQNPDPAWKSTKTRAVPRVPPVGPHKLDGSSAGTTGAQKEGGPKTKHPKLQVDDSAMFDWMAPGP